MHQDPTTAKSTKITSKILGHIPTEVRETFTSEQLQSLQSAFTQVSRPVSHPVNLRLSIPFLGKGFYIVLLAGPERRSKERLQKTQKAWVSRMVMATFMIAGCASVVGLMKFRYAYAGSAHNKPVIEEAQFHPTSLPPSVVRNKEICIESGRTWENRECIDEEHDPNF